MFGGLNMASASAAAPAAAPPAAAPPVAAPPAAAPPVAAADNLLDLMSGGAAAPKSSFGFLNSDAAAPAPPAAAPPAAAAAAAPADATANMFENLSLKGEEQPKTPAPSAPAASAFGFMNTESTEAATSAAAATTPAATSFDPLKNATPNTQKKMMAVSPEQMQAMMYQQMMMQQQVQMAQMQMALQQQRGGPNPQMFMAMPGQVMRNPAASKSTFAFMEKPEKQEDKSFDFVKDAMKSEK